MVTRINTTGARVESADTDRRVLLLAPEDNVLVACTDLPAGTELTVDGSALTLPDTVRIGHKLARVALAADTQVLKYGARIGSTTAAVARGAHVHGHNMKSDYIPSFSSDDERRYREAQ